MFSDYLIFEPIKSINKSFYRCDNKFYLDSVLEMYTNDEFDGIIYVDGSICDFYLVNLGRYSKVKSSTIYLQNQFKNGGQSSNRLSRIRDHIRESYITELSDRTVELFYSKNEMKSKINNLIISGPSYFKNEMAATKTIKQFFDNIHIVTLNKFDQDIINEFIFNINKNSDDNIDIEIRSLIENNEDVDKLVFGIQDIIQNINDKMIKKIYVHSDTIDILENDNTLDLNNVELVKTQSNYIVHYGGIIGIKFY